MDTDVFDRKPYFISDMHFGHKNIIGFCERPYADVQAMDDALVNNWNRRVGMADHIFILGDTSFLNLQDTLQMFDSLKGIKHLVFGNHDKRYRSSADFRGRFASVADYREISVQDGGTHQHLVLCHYPILSWHRMRYGAWMLHGHAHGGNNDLNQGTRRYDVGVDCNNYAPVHYDDIRAKLPAWAPRT